MDIPAYFTSPRYIHTFSRYGVGFTCKTYGLAAPASAIWPTANEAIIMPMMVPVPFNARRAFVGNGSVAGNNFDIGVYNLDGTKLWSSGSTAQAGTTTCQFVAIAPDIIVMSAFYIVLAFNGITGTVERLNPSALQGRHVGLMEQTAAFPLPVSLTPATYTEAYLPLCGLTSTDQ